MIIFETARLLIRRYTENDKEDFFQLNSDPEIMRYIRVPKDYEASAIFLKENLALYEELPGKGRWWMGEKSSGKVVGSFSLLPIHDTPDFHIGFALMKDHWGKGFATESLKGGLEYAFDKIGLSKVYAIAEKANAASVNVLTKCGFLLEREYEEGGKSVLMFGKSLDDRKT